MTYAKIEKEKRLAGLAVLTGWVFLLFGLLLAFSESAVKAITPQPDFYWLVTHRAARDFHALVGNKYTVTAAYGSAGGEVNAKHIADDTKNFSFMVDEAAKDAARHAVDVMWVGLTVPENIMSLRFYDRNTVSNDPQDKGFVEIRGSEINTVLGAPLPSHRVYEVFHLSIDLKPYGFERLDWRSSADPDIRGFYDQFLRVVRLWNPQAEYNPSVLLDLQQEAARGYVFRQRYGSAVFVVLWAYLLFVRRRWLKGLYTAFLETSGIKNSASLLGKDFGLTGFVPDMRVFLKARSLEQLAEETLKRIRDARRIAEEAENRAGSEERTNQGLRDLASCFPADSEECASIEEALAADTRFEVKRKLFVYLRGEANRQPGKKTPEEIEQGLKKRVEFLISLYESVVGDQPDPDALDAALSAEAETDLKVKIALYQEAIQLHRAAQIPNSRIVEIRRPGPNVSKAPEIRVISIRQELYRRLAVVDEIFSEAGVDPQMGRAIIVMLYAPSQSGRRTGWHHPRRTPLEARVERFYDSVLHAGFDDRVFRKASLWLTSEGVIKLGGIHRLVLEEQEVTSDSGIQIIKEVSRIVYSLLETIS